MHLGPVQALLGKYERMRELRVADARGEAGDPRPAMRSLADRFPGALREIDELPLEAIEARIDALRAALRGEATPDWARLSIAYHGLLRVALRLRRAAGKGRELEPALAWLRGHRPAADEPDAAALEPLVGAILRPPGGRLNRWTLSHIARHAGASAEQVEQAIFLSGARRGR